MGVKGGDKVILIEKDDGYFIANANKLALQKAQEGFAGEADRLNLKTVDDVVKLIHDFREGK